MSDLSQKILEEIERRKLVPRPVGYFLARRSVFWAIAIASVLLGACAAAFLIFLVVDLVTTGGRQFDQMPFDDIAPGLPFIAAALFAALMLSAAYGFSQTRRGYLYRPPAVAACAAIASVALGLVFHTAGAGGALHRVLSENFPSYRAYTTIPYEEWSHPELGKLGGTALEEEGTVLMLRDFKGKDWAVDVSGAAKSFPESAPEEGDVAITGTQTGPSAFKAEKIDAFD